jgi:hypothetical protein
MKDLIRVICVILFVSSCTAVPKEIITSHVTILDNVDFAKLETDTFFLQRNLNKLYHIDYCFDQLIYLIKFKMWKSELMKIGAI